MAKTGRNDPCPCGSGKKHKNCCLGRSSSPTLSEGFKASRERAEAIAGRWLGAEPDQKSPLKNAKGERLHLVMDRFALTEAAAVAQVRQLGRAEGETVLFFDQQRWIGEADFSIVGEMTLLTVGEDVADRLRALVKPIKGLVFRQRQVDRLEALQTTPAPAPGMLDFKRRFFQAWPDEVNQRLDGMTPREASTSDALRPKLELLLEELEAKESSLPEAERYCFKHLRSTLGLG